MSRHNYSDDLDYWALIRWRGAVKSAIRGKRGQAMLREMLAALDAMPDKRLIARDLRDEAGEVCALGALGEARGLAELDRLDPEEPEAVANAFGVAEALVREIAWENDDGTWGKETPEDRWKRMREWVAERIIIQP